MGGMAHLTKPGWSKPHTHSNPTNLALFRHKITLYRFNQGGGGSYYGRGLKLEQGGWAPTSYPLTLTTAAKVRWETGMDLEVGTFSIEYAENYDYWFQFVKVIED